MMTLHAARGKSKFCLTQPPNNTSFPGGAKVFYGIIFQLKERCQDHG